MRLNAFLARAGVASRRRADELIKAGRVTVNGEPGQLNTFVAADDDVDASESWLVNRMAEELDVERPDLNRIREEFHDRLSGVREVRKLAQH